MSTVIKAAGAIRAIESGSFNFGDMSDKAKAYLDQVRQDAARIVQQAERDAAAVRARAEREGEQAALQAAERILDEKIGKQLATLLPALRQAVTEIEHARQAWLSQWEKAAIRVATSVACRIARRAAIASPDITVGLVREALELAAGSSDIEIHLHPADHLALGKQTEQLARELLRLGNAKVVANDAVTQGGCRVVTRFGVIDQQFEAQAARIEQELT